MNHAFLTVDLGFGDAGKGSIVDYLTRAHGAHTVIRYNGGAQAGHRVVDMCGNASEVNDREANDDRVNDDRANDEGGNSHTWREHVFAQFGSGTLAGAATHLSRHMLLDPLAMMAEEAHLCRIGISDAFARTTIDREALIITPFQRAVNRLRELARGNHRHGSCGMGIGETVADALAHGSAVLRAGDLLDPETLRTKLAFLRQINLEKLLPLQATLSDSDTVLEEAVAQEIELLCADDWSTWLLEAYAEFTAMARIVPGTVLHEMLRQPGTVIFEGAQGVLLDEWQGFHPYTTWSTTTLANADHLLAEAAYTGQVTRIGMTRAYATRHGAGPFVTEDAMWTAALPDACNGNGAWQQGFRVGPLDLVLLRYAMQVVGRLDDLAVTCLDRLPKQMPVQLCSGYIDANGNRLRQLEPSPQPQDLAYQANLTDLLARCQPIFEEIDTNETLLQVIEDTLGLPVGICSYGPTAGDKIVREKEEGKKERMTR